MLEPRQLCLHSGHKGADAELGCGLRRGQLFSCRKDRQRHAAQAEQGDKQQAGQPLPAVKARNIGESAYML